jgi:hypothetical protein
MELAYCKERTSSSKPQRGRFDRQNAVLLGPFVVPQSLGDLCDIGGQFDWSGHRGGVVRCFYSRSRLGA